MRQEVRINLTAVRDMNPVALGYKARRPRAKSNLPGQQTIMEAALEAYAGLGGPGARLLAEMLHFQKTPSIRINTIGSIIRAPTISSTDWTIASGPGVSGGTTVVGAAAGGAYFWNKGSGGELGLYGSVSLGAVTNIWSISLTAQVCYYFGPAPAMLAGESWIVGVDLGAGIVTGSGFLIFADSMPIQLIGIGFTLGVGSSALPVDFTVQYSKTWIKPSIAV